MKKAAYYVTDRPGAKKELVLFFIIVLVVMYSLGALAILCRSDIERVFGPINDQNLYVTFLIYSPTITGLILTLIFEKPKGLIALFKRAIFSSSPLWWVAGIVILPVIWIVFGLFSKGFDWQNLYSVLPLALLSSRIIIDRGPLGEELGWRGFALPRLLQYHSPLVSTIILSVIWALFHLPAFLSSGMTQNTLSFVWWSSALVAFCFIISWLYVKGGGNWVIAGVIPHYIFNTSLAKEVVVFGPLLSAVLWVAVIIIVICSKNVFMTGSYRGSSSKPTGGTLQVGKN